MNTISKIIRDNNIKWIQLHFTDLLGGLRAVHIPAERFISDHILRQGCGFDGSSVGLKHVEKSDMIAIPDPETFQILPNEDGEARILADIYETTYQPSPVDPRYALKQAVAAAQKQGFDDVVIAPEMEFFVFSSHQEKVYEPLANKAYLVPPPIDEIKKFRRTLSERLIESGINVKYHHHENHGAMCHPVLHGDLHQRDPVDSTMEILDNMLNYTNQKPIH